MSKIFILTFLVVAVVGCGPEKKIHINGLLNGSDSEMIYLQELGEEGKTNIDSLTLSKDGAFDFKKKISQPTFFSLSVNRRNITLLVLPGEKISITGDARHLPATYSLEGSNDSKQIRQLSLRLEHATFVGDSLNKTLQKYAENKNIANIRRQLEWNYAAEIDSLRAYNIRAINQNQQSLVIIYALYQQVEPGVFLFNQEEDLKYFRMADSLFYKRYPKVHYVKTLHSNVLEMNEQDRVRKLNRMLSMLGQQAPEISLPAPNGQKMKLSTHKGKFVLLDFWASWNAPCRTENLELVKIYHKYKDKGFEIFQVSLDQSKASWERAIKEDGLIWTHVSDLKFWDSEVVKVYGVESIPANFLIDKEGTIISKELHGEMLDKKLEELLKLSEDMDI